MVLTNVCRLCLGEENLVWVFDNRFENRHMKDVVHIATGVEISTNDVASQKICGKCCKITIRIFQFRRKSLKSDTFLKEQCKQYLKTKRINIPNTEVMLNNQRIIKSSVSEVNQKTQEDQIKKVIKSEVPDVSENAQEELNQHHNKIFKVHSSIQALYNTYPGLRLPDISLKSDFSPVVSLPMNGVERYFKSLNLDFKLYARLALKSCKNVAKKKTTSLTKFKSSSVNSHKNENKIVGDTLVNVKVNRDSSTNKISIKFTNKKNEAIQSKSYLDSGVAPVTDNTKHFKPKTSNELNLNNMEKQIGQMKRKFSEVERTPHEEVVKKPAIFESLGLTAKPSTSSEDPASVSLHICDICNSVQYSVKGLRKHRNKHLRCQFCKAKFHTLQNKRDHVDTLCLIKNTMSNLPDVVLEKIEYDQEMRKRYPDAFYGFSPIKNGLMDSCQNVTSPTKEKNKCTVLEKTTKLPKVTGDAQAESIKIHLNQLKSLPSTSTHTNQNIGFSNSSVRNTSSLVKSTHKDKGKGTVNNDDKSTTPNSVAQTSISTAHTIAPPIEKFIYNTVSIVKPDVRINNSSVLDNIDPKLSDTKLLKHLLLNYRPQQLSIEQCTQTDIPTNDSISILNHAKATAVLKDLKHQACIFKIPVALKEGPFKVSYIYDRYQKRTTKKLCLWKDLTPVDIKDNNVNIVGDIVNSDQKIIKDEKQGSDVNSSRKDIDYSSASSLLSKTSLPSCTPVNNISDTPRIPTTTYNTPVTIHSSSRTYSHTSSLPAKTLSMCSTVNISNTHVPSTAIAQTKSLPSRASLSRSAPVHSISDTPAPTTAYNIPVTLNSFSRTNSHTSSSKTSSTCSTVNIPNTSLVPSSAIAQTESLQSKTFLPRSTPISSISDTPAPTTTYNIPITLNSFSRTNSHTSSSTCSTVNIPNNSLVPSPAIAQTESLQSKTFLPRSTPINSISDTRTPTITTYNTPVTFHPSSRTYSPAFSLPAKTTSTYSTVNNSNTPLVPSTAIAQTDSLQSKISLLRSTLVKSIADAPAPPTTTYNTPVTLHASSRTYSHVSSLPAKTTSICSTVNMSLSASTATAQSYIPVNNVPTNSSFNNSCGLQSATMAHSDNLINYSEQTQSGRSGTSIDALVSNSAWVPEVPFLHNAITIGSIRVKNVWELT